uniref:DUF38 domain-containing protein n=1 Tax=Panagrolaimus sp. ES5 TaxID=591445 RepID=A0AC34FDK2_9BILA
MKRFSEILDFDEKYLLATSSPTASELISLKPTKIWKKFVDERKITGLNVVTGSMHLDEIDMENDKKFFDAVISKNLICLSRELYIYDADITSEMILQMLSPELYIYDADITFEMILQMLSPCAKVFEVYDSSITPKLTFSDIIKKAPNLEVFSFQVDPSSGTVVYGNTWLKDLLKYKNGKNFVKLDICLDILELDVESLVEFVKTKCMKTTELEIRFNPDLLTEEDGEDEALNGIKQKLAEYFEYYINEDSNLTVAFFAPNLEVFSFQVDPSYGTIVYGNTWLKDLLKYKNGKNFVKLDICLDILEL